MGRGQEDWSKGREEDRNTGAKEERRTGRLEQRKRRGQEERRTDRKRGQEDLRRKQILERYVISESKYSFTIRKQANEHEISNLNFISDQKKIQ